MKVMSCAGKQHKREKVKKWEALKAFLRAVKQYKVVTMLVAARISAALTKCYFFFAATLNYGFRLRRWNLNGTGSIQAATGMQIQLRNEELKFNFILGKCCKIYDLEAIR